MSKARLASLTCNSRALKGGDRGILGLAGCSLTLGLVEGNKMEQDTWPLSASVYRHSSGTHVINSIMCVAEKLGMIRSHMHGLQQ